MRKFLTIICILLMATACFAAVTKMPNLGLEQQDKGDDDWHKPLNRNTASVDVSLGTQHSKKGEHLLVTPDADATRDLGATTFRFRNIYMSGSISDDSNNITVADLISGSGISRSSADARYIQVTGDTMTGVLLMSNNITPTSNNSRDLGSSSLLWKDVWISGDLVVSGISSDLLPRTTATYNLGNTSRQWRSLDIRQDNNESAILIDFNGTGVTGGGFRVDGVETNGILVDINNSGFTTGEGFSLIESGNDLNNGILGRFQYSGASTNTGYVLHAQNSNGTADNVIPIRVIQEGDEEAIFIDQNANGEAIVIDTEGASGTAIIDIDAPASADTFQVLYDTDANSNAVIKIGPAYLWVDKSGVLRIHTSAPAADSDGNAVGGQS